MSPIQALGGPNLALPPVRVFNSQELLGGVPLNVPARPTILTTSDITDTFSPGVHRFTDNGSDISSNWIVLQTLDAAHSQTASQFGGGDPAICCGLDTVIGTSTIPTAQVQLRDSGGVPSGTVCKVYLARSDGNAALWTSPNMAGIDWTIYSIAAGDWGPFTNPGFPANSVTIVFHFPSNPGGAFASISGIQFRTGTGIVRLPAAPSALDFQSYNTVNIEVEISNFAAGDALSLRLNTLDPEDSSGGLVVSDLGAATIMNITGNGTFAAKLQVPQNLVTTILPFKYNVFEWVNTGATDVTVTRMIAWLTRSTRPGLVHRGNVSSFQIMRPDRNNSAGLPGIDWGCSAGGTNGEAMTDDVGPDIGGNTFIRWTGGLGIANTYTGNLTLAIATTNLNGWLFRFTTRTSLLEDARYFMHIRSGGGGAITFAIRTPSGTFPAAFTISDTFAEYVYHIPPADAALLNFAGQPWIIQLDYSGPATIIGDTWDWSRFEIDIPH